MPMGLPTLAWVVVIYFTIQTIEGFLIAPLIQKGSVNLAPAWTLFAIVIFGAIFGAMGVALAAPIFAQVTGGALRTLGVPPDAPLKPLQVARGAAAPVREAM